MNDKLTRIIEELKTLTLLEASDLVKEIEKTFDVDASSNSSSVFAGFAPAVTQASAAPIVEEKTTFDVIISEVPSDKRIPVLKIVRAITGLGLAESKSLVESVPKSVKEGVSKEESENIKKELEAAGAKVILK